MTRTKPGFSFQLSAREGGVGHAVRELSALKTVSCFAWKHIFETEETHEHLDNSIRSFADRLAGRFHGVPRSRWSNSPSAGFRCDFADFALCAGPARRVRRADTPIRSCPLLGSNTKHNCFFANPRASCPELKGWNLT